MERYKVGNVMLEKNGEEVRAVRIVTEQKGSWKWQDAYRVAWYRVRYSPRQKRHFWQSETRSGKFAMNSSNMERYDGIPHGSLHNHPVSGEELAAIGTLIGESEVSRG